MITVKFADGSEQHFLEPGDAGYELLSAAEKKALKEAEKAARTREEAVKEKK